MRTDSLFYQLFNTSPSIFFELIGRPAAEASSYEFSSVEIKQPDFRIDATQDWGAVLVYPRRSLEPDESGLYRALLESPQVQRVYLDELAAVVEPSLGLGLVQLIVESEAQAANRARRLIEQSQQEAVAGLSRRGIIELI